MNKASIAIFSLMFFAASPVFCEVPVTVAAETAPLTVGYAVVTPVTGSASDLRLTQTFGFMQGSNLLMAETAAPALTTSALLFVNMSDLFTRNVGLAIVNPDATEATLTMTLRRDDGIMVGVPATVFVPARFQTAQFVTEFFSKQTTIPAEFTGTLSITSNVPVALLAVRFRDSSFTDEPLSQTSTPGPLPQFIPGLNTTGSYILPDFAQGGGWATQIIMVNSGAADMIVRVDLYTPRGEPMSGRLNGKTASTFYNLLIRSGGTLVLATLDANGNSLF